MKKTIGLSLLAFSSLFADADLDALKEQMAQQKLVMQKLEAKIDAMNKKQVQIQQIQIEQKKVNEKAIQATANTSASFSQNAYLPDIALILNMGAVGRNAKNSDYTNFAIPGFIASGDAELPFNKDKGFNLNYAEVAMHSTVDPYFDAFAIFHLHPAAFEIEEAFVRTRALPFGLRIKAGKFKSAFGRLNEKHQHSWHFDEQAIIYKALFGPDSISDAGVQVQWVAPTDTYLMVGAEAMQGANERSFGGTDKGPEKNNLYVSYVKSSIDVGDDLSILGGVSLAHGKHLGNTSNVYGADLTMRDQLGGYSALIWQSEYLERHMGVDGGSTDKQAGLYSELVYQYNNHYSGGFRYDAITKNDTDLSNYAGLSTSNLDKYTAMLEYHPFPMSRLRLSYSYDRTKVIAGERKNLNEVMMTLNIAAGAHGAHNY